MRKLQEIRASIKSINRRRKEIRDERRRLARELLHYDMYWEKLRDELKAVKAEAPNA